MSRMDGISDKDASFVTRQVFRAAGKKLGAVPDPLRIYAHSPPVMFAAGAFETSWGMANTVDPVLKDLCQLKVSAMVGCVF